jgi:hypothetical protein
LSPIDCGKSIVNCKFGAPPDSTFSIDLLAKRQKRKD